MSYALRWEPRGVVKVFYGRVTEGELWDSVRAVHGDFRFDSLRWVINDFLEANEVTISRAIPDEIAAVDAAAARTNPRVRVAFVAANPVLRKLAEQYVNSTLNSYPSRVFATMSEARDWAQGGAEMRPLS